MKKILTILSFVLWMAIPTSTLAVYSVPLFSTNTTGNPAYSYFNGHYLPFQAPYFTATSSTATSSLPIASSTVICLGEVCNTAWNTGTVTSITATSPLTGGTITTSGSIGCQTASGSQAGCLSSADWTTFNNKQPNYFSNSGANTTLTTGSNLIASTLTATSSLAFTTTLGDSVGYSIAPAVDPANSGVSALEVTGNSSNHDLYFGLPGNKFYDTFMYNSNYLRTNDIQINPPAGGAWYITGPSGSQLQIGSPSAGGGFWEATYGANGGASTNVFSNFYDGVHLDGVTLRSLGISGQTGNLQDWQAYGGVKEAQLSIGGTMTAQNFVATSTATSTFTSLSTSATTTLTKLGAHYGTGASTAIPCVYDSAGDIGYITITSILASGSCSAP